MDNLNNILDTINNDYYINKLLYYIYNYNHKE